MAVPTETELETELKERIANISAILRRSGIPYAERLLLHENRGDLRELLASLHKRRADSHG